MSEFNRKNVLITGAAHGIGKLMAGMVANLGGNLIICDVNGPVLEATAKELRRPGIQVSTYAFDISDREAVYSIAQRIQQEVGQVDILINNAGIVFTGEILDLPDDKHRKQVEVNLMGTLWMLKAFVPQMVKRNEGHIVNVASSAGMLAMPGMGFYSATKHALMGLNDALRNELYNCGAKKIRVTVVCPYIIDTGMFEGMKTLFFLPPLKPEAMARAVIRGVLKNRSIIGKPFLVFLPPIVKALFPPFVLDISLRLTGFNKALYSCKGFYKK
jgi:all-trans-retinol dehydrogenase (NAD+)